MGFAIYPSHLYKLFKMFTPREFDVAAEIDLGFDWPCYLA